ncbi:hypothetical protein MGYG_07735 [Nannizzia gypsea CBS 118893]|uniref:Uncharacterized protein n=1 Tax=Arthroderma gypseum (strain ATCC MYA-4604 / CBS 118893) TaxID=535722 RepID=E4V403_ARTGP|nr:hypothetical protein MGYG_07735 [Nannizzia gypsea CBS 118893]EFR04727.1 hypothetical protein MGYG_07735 [Nannizzia gypsea CBS 118893]
MEGKDCHQPPSAPLDLQSPGPALVRLPALASYSFHQGSLTAPELPSFGRHRQARKIGERRFQTPVIFPPNSETGVQPANYPTASPRFNPEELGTYSSPEPESIFLPTSVKSAEAKGFSPPFDAPSVLAIQKTRLPNLSHSQRTVFPQWPLHGTRSRYATAPPRAHIHPLSPAPVTQKPIKKRYREVSRERPAILTKLMDQFNVRDWSRPETHPEVTNDKDRNGTGATVECSAPSSSQQIYSEVNIYYPRLKDSDSSCVPPKSAPLVNPAVDNMQKLYQALPLSTKRERQPGLRKVSSAPDFLAPEMDTKDVSGHLNGDARRQSNFEGIILGGPLLIATRRGSHFTDKSSEHVQVSVIPSIHGTCEGTVAPGLPPTMPTEPAATHTHNGDVINARFEQISMAQAANTDAILRSLQGLTNEIRALRVEVRANTNHLHQLSGRVAAVEARLGGQIQQPGGWPLTGYQEPVNMPRRNSSSSQPPAKHPNHRGSKPHSSGHVRDVQYGDTNRRRVPSQQQHAGQSPHLDTTLNPLHSPTEPLASISTLQGSQGVPRNRKSGRPRRDASFNNGEWGGTSNWYRKSYVDNKGN